MAAELARESLTEHEVDTVISELALRGHGYNSFIGISTDEFGYKSVVLKEGTFVFDPRGYLGGVFDEATVVAPSVMIAKVNSSDKTLTVLAGGRGEWQEVAHIPLYEDLTFESQHGLKFAKVNEGVITLDKNGDYGSLYKSISFDDFVGRSIATVDTGLLYALSADTGRPTHSEGCVSFGKSGRDVFGQRKDGIKVRV